MINPSGQPIRGKIEPFKPVLDPILKNATTNNGIEIFREYLKDAIALRLQLTLYTPIEIDDKCISIINKYISNDDVFSFVRCCLKYYCNKKNHKIANLNTSCSSFNSKDYHKSLQHAKQDCLVCNKYYIKALKQKTSIYNDASIINICVNIDFSIRFVCNYIYAMLEGVLPKELKSSTFNSINAKNPSISKLYSYNDKGGYYILNNKTTYQAVSLDTATEIFCGSYTF